MTAADNVQWIFVLVSLLLNLIVGPSLGVPTMEALFLITLPFILMHGIRRYGFPSLAVLIVAALVISNLYENCSIITGFPFGRYHYTGTLKLFLVPVTIGPYYIAIGYLCWQTANVILDIADVRLHRSVNLVLLPALAAAFMAMYDLTADPQASTIDHVWIWENGGSTFGVPATNFMGWWLCTYSFFQVFALYLRSRASVRPLQQSRQFWAQPIILYFNLGLVTVVTYFTSADGTNLVTAMNGVTWRTYDLHEASMTVFLFTVCVVTVLALARLFEWPRPANE